jgi:hypothetical protein
MSPLIYNLSSAIGVLMVGVGSGLEYGLGRGLWISGAAVVGLTVFGAIASRWMRIR